MKYDFDQVVERKGTDSIKWQRYGNEVIPLWVADMDFVSPEPIVKALHERVDHRVFGYGGPGEELISVIQERLKKLYRMGCPGGTHRFCTWRGNGPQSRISTFCRPR